jgi:peptidyl-tRNA hydrolase
MYIVVRKETEKNLGELGTDAILAVQACDRSYRNHPEYGEQFGQWYEGSFRKVTLRAKPAQWQRLIAEYDHAQVGDVLVLPPRAVSGRDPFLRKLQTFQGVLNPPEIWDGNQTPDETVYLINRELGMSAGKTLAQLCHGALMITDHVDTTNTVPQVYYAADWEQAANDYTVLPVRDGGLTEIEAGSETVLVLV